MQVRIGLILEALTEIYRCNIDYVYLRRCHPRSLQLLTFPDCCYQQAAAGTTIAVLDCTPFLPAKRQLSTRAFECPLRSRTSVAKGIRHKSDWYMPVQDAGSIAAISMRGSAARSIGKDYESMKMKRFYAKRTPLTKLEKVNTTKIESISDGSVSAF